MHQRPDPQRAEEAARLPGVRQAHARPQTPLGATMVSAEGACAAYYPYGRISTARQRWPGAMPDAMTAPLDIDAGPSSRHRCPALAEPEFGHALPDQREGSCSATAAAASSPPELIERPLPAGVRRTRCCDALEDQADAGRRRRRGIAFTTDSYVVTPLFFPGGDIGELAVHGTVNDLAMSAARRRSTCRAAFILEEGLPLADLRAHRRLDAARRAPTAGVRIVTGDTKVVGRGKGDRRLHQHRASAWSPAGVDLSAARRRPGDAHPALRHDRRPRHRHHVGARRARSSRRRSRATPPRCTAWSRRCWPPAPRSMRMRDPTRGGLAATLNEIAARQRRRRRARRARASRPRRGARGLRDARARPAATSPTRASWSPSSRRRTRERGAGGHARRIRSGATARHHRPGHRRSIRAWSLLRTPDRRRAHPRLAVRRAAAAHLLSARRGAHCMCLGIVDRLVAFDDTNPELAKVDVAGATRRSTSASSRTTASQQATGS